MKPKVLVLGGCGFIGRNLVDYLIRENEVELIRVVDKVPPQIAWLNAGHQETFSDPRVTFKSTNLMNPDSCQAAFHLEDGCTFEYVINCACETKMDQSDAIYNEGIYKLSMLCANEAARCGVRKYVELSSGYMSSNAKNPFKENDKKEPWTAIARWKSKVEESLKDVKDLNYIIIRPAIVYGTGDRASLMPLMVIGAIYKHLGECMKWLWTCDMKMNTVHVHDVCRAIWHLLLLPSEPKGEIYHVVDESDTTQGLIAELIGDIFQISYEFIGTPRTLLAKMDLNHVTEEVNDKHLKPWAELCNIDEIAHTPLSPFISKELIDNKPLYLSGTKLSSTNFTYSIPYITAHKIKEVLDDYISMKLFPTSFTL